PSQNDPLPQRAALLHLKQVVPATFPGRNHHVKLTAVQTHSSTVTDIKLGARSDLGHRNVLVAERHRSPAAAAGETLNREKADTPRRSVATASRARLASHDPRSPTGDNVWASRARSQRPSGCLRYTVIRCPANCATSPPARGVTDNTSRLRVKAT